MTDVIFKDALHSYDKNTTKNVFTTVGFVMIKKCSSIDFKLFLSTADLIVRAIGKTSMWQVAIALFIAVNYILSGDNHCTSVNNMSAHLSQSNFTISEAK